MRYDTLKDPPAGARRAEEAGVLQGIDAGVGNAYCGSLTGLRATKPMSRAGDVAATGG